MHTIHAPRVAPLDPARIASISGAIVANGVLLALLLAPMSAPMVKMARETVTTIVPLPKLPENPPPPPQDPIRVHIEHTTTPHPAPEVRRQPDPQPVLNDDPQPGDTQVVATNDALHTSGPVGDPIATEPGPPMHGAHLEYASNPAPAYPRGALADNLEGTVLLEVTVDIDGRPIDVRISRSSGHRVLDIAARRQVLSSWRFRPAMREGRAVQAIGLVPVDFKLN